MALLLDANSVERPAALRLHVLGPIEAHANGVPLPLGGPQQRAVLAMLLMARNSVVPAARITDLLWRDTDRRKALGYLHPLISNLRRVLEPGRPPRSRSGLILSASPGYVLRVPEESVDAWRFEAAVRQARAAQAEDAWHLLREALGWWHGAAYSECADEDWAVQEVARLSELRLMARELLFQVGLAAGRAAEVVPLAEAFVREVPLREGGWRLLALALWAGGRQADALASLRRARAVLAETVGLFPDPALTELEQAILRGERDVLHQVVPRSRLRPMASDEAAMAHEAPARQQSLATADRSRTSASPEARATRGDEPLIGRAAEMRLLMKAARVAARRGAVVMVSGEPGSGKSTLLQHFGHTLQSEGWLVITGRCPESEGAPPAWAWVEALGELAEVCPPVTVGPLAALLEPGDAREQLTADAAAGRFKVHAALKDWLSAAAVEQPIALFVDDLHRADIETLMLLNCAASVRAPVLVVTAFRPEAAGAQTEPLRAELARLTAYRLTLQGLDEPEVAELLSQVCGTPATADIVTALAERTGGNPFFVTEYAHLLSAKSNATTVAEVPEAIRDVLRMRMAFLTGAQRDVLYMAAVCGQEADVSVLVEACELPSAEVLDTLEICVRAGLLTEPMPGRIRFAHALLRDVVYGDLTGVRRSVLHGTLAQVLERQRPNDLDALALHFGRSGAPDKAPATVTYAVKAAERAERRYAHDVAADLLAQAINAVELIPYQDEERAERLVELHGRRMRAQVRAGAVAAAQATGERAVQEARGVGRDDLVAGAFASWTEPTPWLTRRHWAADEYLVDTLDRLLTREDLDPSVNARLLQRLVDEIADSGAGHAAEAADRQLAIARGTDDPALLAAAFTTMTKLMPHELQEERYTQVVGELRELVRHHDLPAYQWVCEHVGSMIAAIRNDVAAVYDHAERGLRIAHRFHIAGAEAASLATLAMLAHARGEFDEAEAFYVRVRERLSGHNPWHGADIHTRGMITIRLTQGRVAEIEPLTRTVYETWGPHGGEALALILAVQGKTDEARQVRYHRDPPRDHFYGVRLGARARLACIFDDVEAAERLIPLLEPVRNQFGSAATTAFCTRPLAQALGELYKLLGDWQAARAAFSTAERVAGLWGAANHVAVARACAEGLPV